MKLFKVAKDGGKESPVTGLFLIEWKEVFSIVLLRFGEGSRENYHSHAFNALTFWMPLSKVKECFPDGSSKEWRFGFKWTPKNNMHKIETSRVSYALSIRGGWDKTWDEYNETTNSRITLSKGRKVERIEALG
jgi:hypothetical protein